MAINSNMFSMIKQALPMMKMAGIDLDKIVQSSLTFLPDFFIEKIEKFQAQAPELEIFIMTKNRKNPTTQEEEIWLIPVGMKGRTIAKEFEPLNLNELLQNINIEEMLKTPLPEEENEPTKLPAEQTQTETNAPPQPPAEEQ